jgi:RNA polymerase sigma factor (sigma-70 family)
MGQSDSILLQRFARTGDAAAFSEIIKRHAGLVYGACLRILTDADKAADAAQETFLHLLRNAGQITGSVPAWLHKVATGKAADVVRRDRSRKRREAEYIDRKQHQATEWKHVSPYVDEALAELDEQTAEILVHYFFESRSMAQIGAEEGTSRATVSRRIEAGVVELRRKLRGRGVTIAAAALGSLLGENAAEAAPALVMKELGKIALVGGQAAAGGSAVAAKLAASGILAVAKAKIIVAAAVAVVSVGGILVYKHVTRPIEQSGPQATGRAIPRPKPTGNTWETTEDEPAQVNEVAGDAKRPGPSIPDEPKALDTAGTRTHDIAEDQPPEIDLSSPKATVNTFVRLLEAGDMDKIAECFVEGADDLEDLRTIMEDPDPKYDEIRQVFKSVGAPIEIFELQEDENGVWARWWYTVKKPFTIEGHSWEVGDKFEFDITLEEVDGEWRVAGV